MGIGGLSHQAAAVAVGDGTLITSWVDMPDLVAASAVVFLFHNSISSTLAR